mmetsp:Transcript_43378/g.135895  ORF Transcript_43378/g.135895 Transcript_43378/m.135895 type:complete len:733 (-) Transcript_43378:388-2586(-)
MWALESLAMPLISYLYIPELRLTPLRSPKLRHTRTPRPHPIPLPPPRCQNLAKARGDSTCFVLNLVEIALAAHRGCRRRHRRRGRRRRGLGLRRRLRLGGGGLLGSGLLGGLLLLGGLRRGRGGRLGGEVRGHGRHGEVDLGVLGSDGLEGVADDDEAVGALRDGLLGHALVVEHLVERGAQRRLHIEDAHAPERLHDALGGRGLGLVELLLLGLLLLRLRGLGLLGIALGVGRGLHVLRLLLRRCLLLLRGLLHGDLLAEGRDAGAEGANLVAHDVALLPHGLVVPAEAQAGLAADLLLAREIVAEADDVEQAQAELVGDEVEAHEAHVRLVVLVGHVAVHVHPEHLHGLVGAAQLPLELLELLLLRPHGLLLHHRGDLELAHERLEGLRAEDHGEEGLAVHEVHVLVEAVLAGGVVLLPQLVVAEHLVGVAHLLELLVRVGVVRVLVRVQLERELVVRLLDGALGRVGLHAEHVVVLAGMHLLVLAALALALREAHLRARRGALLREDLVDVHGLDGLGLLLQVVAHVGARAVVPLLARAARRHRRRRVHGALGHLLHGHGRAHERHAHGGDEPDAEALGEAHGALLARAHHGRRHEHGRAGRHALHDVPGAAEEPVTEVPRPGLLALEEAITLVRLLDCRIGRHVHVRGGGGAVLRGGPRLRRVLHHRRRRRRGRRGALSLVTHGGPLKLQVCLELRSRWHRKERGDKNGKDGGGDNGAERRNLVRLAR